MPSTRPTLGRLATAGLSALTLLALAACSTGGSGAAGSGGAATAGSSGPITVSATDTECTLSAATAAAGTLTFAVSNKGTKVNEFYVYAAGDRIVGEVENITPGLSRELKIEVTEPGTLTTACKPGMVGDGIRAAFAVTGTAAPGKTDEKVATAISAYTTYVGQQADALVAQTGQFVAAVKAGDVATAKALYPKARLPWERIEPVAASFGDLDPKVDGREDVVAEGMAFTGYHRLEKDLWVDGLQADSGAMADQLLADVTTVAAEAKKVQLTGLAIASGAKALLDEVATGKVTGEEERYSHTDLWDFQGNVEGSAAALDALKPVIQARQPELQTALDTTYQALWSALTAHRGATGDYVAYTALTPDQVKALSVALDAFSEQVARVPAVVATP
ncbi:MAG: iron uptake system protein EfeO [Lapillicoccus sp.]